MNKNKEGNCSICGNYGLLTKEHVPPQKAFNSRSFISLPREKVDGLRYDERPKAKPIQGGIHYNSLCVKCNNNTGTWYGSSYVDWCYDAYEIGIKSSFKPTIFHLHNGFPLRIIKQIITMFCSVNENLSKRHPELIKFLLNKEEKYLTPKLRIYAYYNFEGNLRYTSIAASGNGSIFSEIAFPPFGFVMTYNSPPPDERMYDITFFSESGYNEYREVTLKMIALPTHLHVPGTYLEKDEIEKNYTEYNKNKQDYI